MAKLSDMSERDEVELDRLAKHHGFLKKRNRTWTRRTDDFVQLVNLQRSPGKVRAFWVLAIATAQTTAFRGFLQRLLCAFAPQAKVGYKQLPASAR